jgi:hypothetical protein
MRERDSREEDKEEGRGLGRGLIFFGFGKIMEEGEEEEENWENSLFWGTLTGHCCFWEFWAQGPGNRKDSWS